jgi:GntR family transcriptional regulator
VSGPPGTVHDTASFLSLVGAVGRDDSVMYAQIADAIAAAISDDRLLPGDRLPPERELATGLGVSRDTVRQALRHLSRYGHVRREVGRAGGTFIAEPKIRHSLAPYAGLTDQLRDQRIEGGSRVISARERTAGPAIAAALELKPGGRVLEIYRVRLADGRPVALERSSFPADRFPGLLAFPLEGSIYDLLRTHYHEVPVRAIEYLEPILAGPDEAAALEIEEGAPLMFVERITYAKDGDPLEFSRDVFRGDRTRMVVVTSDETTKR